MSHLFKAISYLIIPLWIMNFHLVLLLSHQEESEKKSEEEKPYVYTNEDLEKYAVGEASSEEEPEEQPTYEMIEEMIKKIKEPERIRKWRDAKLKAAEERVTKAEKRLDYLRKKKASILNPLLPRPKLTPEDAREEAGMDNVKRLERTEKQIEEAKEELKKLEKELEELKQTLRRVGI